MDPEHVRFRCTINDDQYVDIIMYNELMDYIQKNAENDEMLWPSSVSPDTRGRYVQVIPTTQVRSTTCRLSGRQGRFLMSPLTLLLLMTPSHVQSMQGTMTSWIYRVGGVSRSWPPKRGNSSGLLDRPRCILTNLPLDTSLVTAFQLPSTRLSPSTRPTVTPSGRMLPCLR